MAIDLNQIWKLVGGELSGDGSTKISGISEIDSAKEGTITFLANMLYKRYLDGNKAGALILPAGMDYSGLPAIRVDNPHVAKARIIELFHPEKKWSPSIAPDCNISESAKIADGYFIGSGCVISANAEIGANTRIISNVFIGENVKIGADSLIGANTTILDDVSIGERADISPGCVIGCDGFGFVPDGDGIAKVPQVGSVVIGNDVAIGANCCIDRGTISNTIIHDGVKLDNLIQIAHNVEIGEYTVIAGQSGVAGSAKIGKGVMVGGQVAITGHVELGNGIKVAGKSGVSKSFPDGVTISGYYAIEHFDSLKKEASLKKIPNLSSRIKALEEQVKRLTEEAGKND